VNGIWNGFAGRGTGVHAEWLKYLIDKLLGLYGVEKNPHLANVRI
jgi:hypothetical protein